MSVFPKLPKLLHSQASSEALGVDNFKSLLSTRLLFPSPTVLLCPPGKQARLELKSLSPTAASGAIRELRAG